MIKKRLKNLFISRCKIEIHGMNQEKIFNKILSKNIQIYELERHSHSHATFLISHKNLNKTVEVLNQNQVEIKTIKNLGLIKMYSMAILRFGILVGFCLSLILFFISNNFIFSIKIYGTKNINDNEIIELLKSENVGILINKALIDNSKLEFLMLEKFENISMVSIIKKGTSLIINVKEKEIYENENENQYVENIFSKYNGRLIELKLINGTSKKKIGDIVRAGDLIVAGYYIDSKGKKQKIKPQAKFKLEVWIESKAVHNDYTFESEYTGKEIKFISISIFNLEVFNNSYEINFEKFEKHENIKKITNLFLPLKIKYTTLKEIELVQKFVSFENVKANLIEICKQNALQRLEENDIIKNEKIKITPHAGFTIINYLMIVEKEFNV